MNRYLKWLLIEGLLLAGLAVVACVPESGLPGTTLTPIPAILPIRPPVIVASTVLPTSTMTLTSTLTPTATPTLMLTP